MKFDPFGFKNLSGANMMSKLADMGDGSASDGVNSMAKKAAIVGGVIFGTIGAVGGSILTFIHVKKTLENEYDKQNKKLEKPEMVLIEENTERIDDEEDHPLN